MNKNIRNLVGRTKKFIRAISVSDDYDDVENLLGELGLHVCEDPQFEDAHGNMLLVSNRPITIGDYVKWYDKDGGGDDEWTEYLKAEFNQSDLMKDFGHLKPNLYPIGG